MRLCLFFPSKKSRIDFIKEQFKVEKITIEDNKLISPIIPGISLLRFKTSDKQIPGYWIELIFNKSINGKALYHSFMKIIDTLITDKNVFYPITEMKPMELESKWSSKYKLMDIDYPSDDNWRLFFIEAKGHLKANRYNVCYHALKVILKYNPFFLKKYKRYYIFEELAYHYEEVNNLGKAINCLKIHMMLQPDSIEPYLNMSSFYIINGMEEEAVKICEEALKKKSNNKFLISNLIIALNNLGNYEYAVDYLKEVIEKQPGNAFFWKLMGDVLYELERNNEAVDCYEKALEKLKIKKADDFTIDLYNGIAATNFELENYEEAIKYYGKSLKLSPDDSYTLLSLSQIYLYKLKDEKKALLHTKRLIDMFPENGYAHYQIGIIYSQLENYEKAKWHLYKARRIMPNYEPVNEAIKFLKQIIITKVSE
ncbi:tetratricopeptide repeat protein [Alkaliphilus peptidifermentans]|uniref:Tetratricopeptide repeat-containing protein n=1 Tax=Alkaliphilus peptidifermentans DSM 18978 TaxID=1120976 RepID=A0A1G5BYM3_9FIRM|nr:tetratricopeptide repeat protein [Alkaliphilus peptidifermentans]SCX95295.1 Tetratricopeptide repeat-containing protein [Alkaliphilus peptidifermentans DSM 18978]